jgi:hypothetical protein
MRCVLGYGLIDLFQWAVIPIHVLIDQDSHGQSRREHFLATSLPNAIGLGPPLSYTCVSTISTVSVVFLPILQQASPLVPVGNEVPSVALPVETDLLNAWNIDVAAPIIRVDPIVSSGIIDPFPRTMTSRPNFRARPSCQNFIRSDGVDES